MWDTTAVNLELLGSADKDVKIRGIPHLAKEARYPEFPARGAGKSCVCAFL
jgi:hypothetical protein